jgi:nicotinamide mononucleotide transporter
MDFFNISTIAFEFLGYHLSYVELIATITGIFSIYFASRSNILTWGTGIINAIFLFILFFQIQLYVEMFLQIYFIIICIYGWYYWSKKTDDHKISICKTKTLGIYALILLFGTFISGYLVTNIHLYFPEIFKVKASFPYTDSFIMIGSIIASFLLAKKKMESWIMWLFVDIVCFLLFIRKGVLFLSFEYAVFTGLVVYGFFKWNKDLEHE